MPISQEQVYRTKPCLAQLQDYEHTDGGPVHCTRPVHHGEQGLPHADQSNGNPIEWTDGPDGCPTDIRWDHEPKPFIERRRDTSKPRSIQKVVIQRAEGIADHYTMRKVTFIGNLAEANGNQWLREIAKTAPVTGGYDKTDVWVTLSSGQEFKLRFDVQHTSLPNNDTDIREHVRSWLVFTCRPEEIPHIAAHPRRLQRVQASTTPEQKALAAQLLALLDGDRL